MFGNAGAPTGQPWLAHAPRPSQGASMSPFFTDLEDQMRSAARDQAGAFAGADEVPVRRRRQRRWLRAGTAAVPIVASVLVTLFVVGAAFVLSAHRGSGGTPPQGAPPPGGRLSAIVLHTPRRALQREL